LGMWTTQPEPMRFTHPSVRTPEAVKVLVTNDVGGAE
jgi:hypothetical protein